MSLGLPHSLVCPSPRPSTTPSTSWHIWDLHWFGLWALPLALLALHCLPRRPVTDTAFTTAGAESPAFPLTTLPIVYGFLVGICGAPPSTGCAMLRVISVLGHAWVHAGRCWETSVGCWCGAGVWVAPPPGRIDWTLFTSPCFTLFTTRNFR